MLTDQFSDTYMHMLDETVVISSHSLPNKKSARRKVAPVTKFLRKLTLYLFGLLSYQHCDRVQRK